MGKEIRMTVFVLKFQMVQLICLLIYNIVLVNLLDSGFGTQVASIDFGFGIFG